MKMCAHIFRAALLIIAENWEIKKTNIHQLVNGINILGCTHRILLNKKKKKKKRTTNKHTACMNL